MSGLDLLLSYEADVRFKSTLNAPFPWVSVDRFMRNHNQYYIHFKDDISVMSQDNVLAVVFSFMDCEPLLL